MRKPATWLGIVILLIGGILIIMLYKEDPDQTVNDHEDEDTNFNIDEYREKLKDKGLLISKDRAKQKFDPNKKGKSELGNLSFELKEISENGSKTFDFIIENVTEEIVTLSFGTSQRYDYEIFNQENIQVYHYSEGKSFLQVLEDIQLEPGQHLNYEITIPSLEAGEYTLVVRLAARGYGQLRQTTTFTVN